MSAASTLVAIPPVPTPLLPGRAERHRAQVGGPVHGVDEPGRAGARVAVVDAVDVGEQDERVGPGDVRDERRQPVVVAEADLLGGHRVVLVDHRQDAEGQQPLHGLAGVLVVAAPGEVVGGEQHLADGDPVAGEGVGVGLHQPQLADAGRGLGGGEVTRPALDPQRRQAGGDRAGRDEDDLPAGGALRRRARRPAPTAGRRPARPAAWSATRSPPSPRRGGRPRSAGARHRRRGPGHCASSGTSSGMSSSVQPGSLSSYGMRRSRLGGQPLLGPHPVRRLQPVVGAPATEARGLLRGEGSGGQGRHPVEGDAADGDRVALARPRPWPAAPRRRAG